MSDYIKEQKRINTYKEGFLEDRILERLEYDPSTGLITNKRNGKEAGCKHNSGSRLITFSSKEEDYYFKMSSYRIAWFLHYGKWPEGFVDHINGIRDDDRIDNLRVVNYSQNAMNSRPQANASVKYKGVRLMPAAFIATITVNSKQVHLGTFQTAEDAAIAYNEAAAKHYGEYARLNEIS